MLIGCMCEQRSVRRASYSFRQGSESGLEAQSGADFDIEYLRFAPVTWLP